MKSDCRWVTTERRRYQDVVNEIKWFVEKLNGNKITKITSIQNQFKHKFPNGHTVWSSHVWYEYI